MSFKKYLEEKGFWSKALLGASLLAGSGHAADKFELPEPPKTFIDYNKQSHSQAEIDVLAATLILEAGAETDSKSLIAIFNVLQNRAKKHKNTSSEYEEAISPKQFSCWNGSNESSRKSKIKELKSHPKWEIAVEIVKKGLNDQLEDVTKKATHYHVFRGRNKVSPDWSHPNFGGKNKNAELTATIGDHVFFKNVDKLKKKKI